MQLPPGYEEHVLGDVTMIARAADMPFVRDAVSEGGSLHAFAANAAGSRPMPGRGIAYAIDTGPAHWLVRHYQRGGAAAALLDDRYLRTAATPRPLAELIVSEAARARGIATPRVTAATIHNRGAFYRGDIATEFLPNARDLAVLTLGARPWTEDAREAAWRAAGAMLRMAFERGLIHPDLNMKNVLVEKIDGGVAAHVIDLDRAHLRSAATLSERARMVARFERSRTKIERATGRTVRHEERRAFKEGLGL